MSNSKPVWPSERMFTIALVIALVLPFAFIPFTSAGLTKENRIQRWRLGMPCNHPGVDQYPAPIAAELVSHDWITPRFEFDDGDIGTRMAIVRVVFDWPLAYVREDDSVNSAFTFTDEYGSVWLSKYWSCSGRGSRELTIYFAFDSTGGPVPAFPTLDFVGAPGIQGTDGVQVNGFVAVEVEQN